MSPENIQINIENTTIKNVNEYNYLGNNISLGKKTNLKISQDE